MSAQARWAGADGQSASADRMAAAVRRVRNPRSGGTDRAIAATNIGKADILDGGAPTIEPHLLDFAGDLYGKMIHVELHKFLRPEMQFESVEALKTAIEENVRQTREFFKEK